MSEKLKRQNEFVEWLKNEQMYNEYYSASQMEFAFMVWITRQGSEEVEKLRQEIDRLRYKLECAESHNATI